jgi:nicotinate-nucleotide pyrophosphorylase (carboxylating)
LPGGGGADVVLLDNFTPEMMREAVGIRDEAARGGRGPLLEASGGITGGTIVAVAESGVDRISIGALTHSAGALDLSMEMD